jgi:hypothetical protein
MKGKKMKRIFLLIFLVVGLFQFSQAQEVGIRFGDALGGNYAVDGVFSLGEFSRVHADVSFGDGVGIEALWDFFYRPLGSGFNWYIGVGPSAFLGDPFLLGVAGEIGLEYHFDFPLAIGADWRPTFILIENTDFEAGWFGLNVRFVFN